MDIKDLNISPELREKAKACTSPDEIETFAKNEGVSLNPRTYEALALYAGE